MNAPTSLFLLRHAEVETRYYRTFGGRIDMEISPHGHRQANALAGYLRPQAFDAIYLSPMKRVQQTMAPFLKDRDCPQIVMEGLREVDFGDWTGMGWDEVKAKFNVSAFEWLQQLEMNAIPNAESGTKFRARVEPCIRKILGDHPGQTVAVACHGGTIRMILSILLGLPLSQMAAFDIEYASITQLKYSEHKTEIQLLNFAPWRDLP